MPMLGVVPRKEVRAVRARVFDRPEALRKVRAVLESLELRFGIRIVVRHMRAGMGLRHAEIGEE